MNEQPPRDPQTTVEQDSAPEIATLEEARALLERATQDVERAQVECRRSVAEVCEVVRMLRESDRVKSVTMDLRNRIVLYMRHVQDELRAQMWATLAPATLSVAHYFATERKSGAAFASIGAALTMWQFVKERIADHRIKEIVRTLWERDDDGGVADQVRRAMDIGTPARMVSWARSVLGRPGVDPAIMYVDDDVTPRAATEITVRDNRISVGSANRPPLQRAQRGGADTAVAERAAGGEDAWHAAWGAVEEMTTAALMDNLVEVKHLVDDVVRRKYLLLEISTNRTVLQNVAEFQSNPALLSKRDAINLLNICGKQFLRENVNYAWDKRTLASLHDIIETRITTAATELLDATPPQGSDISEEVMQQFVTTLCRVEPDALLTMPVENLHAIKERCDAREVMLAQRIWRIAGALNKQGQRDIAIAATRQLQSE